MTRAEGYRRLAFAPRHQWEHLAESYVQLAKQTEESDRFDPIYDPSTERSNNGGGDGTIEIRATERRAHDRISQFRFDLDPRVRGANFEPEQSCVGRVPKGI